MTALMTAIHANDATGVRQLIAQGVDVNLLDAHRDAPLVMAAYLGNAEIVLLLLEAGADVTAVDPGMRATALHAAAYAGNTEAARLLVQFHIDIDKQGPVNGYTALHDAIWQGHLETARALIDAGANLALRSLRGETPLAFAQSRQHNAIADLIVQKMAQPSAG
ncbi:MAG: ankyrin repeat domain-containing protein [Rhodoferax sp.]|nr:ankyrin repeat domain-containing protein [Rhodoferax sp.]MCF8208297.1 ankyrin repeat domain-containing protein [Rhodoferax sp.]